MRSIDDWVGTESAIPCRRCGGPVAIITLVCKKCGMAVEEAEEEIEHEG